MAPRSDSADDIFQPDGKLRLDLLTESATRVIRESLSMARDTRWDSVRSPHLFMGLLAVPDSAIHNWGHRLQADLDRLLSQFKELFLQEDGAPDPIPVLSREFFSDNVIRLLRDARVRAREHRRNRITPMDLLITLLTASNSIVAECFEHIGVTAARLTELAVIAEQQGGAGD